MQEKRAETGDREVRVHNQWGTQGVGPRKGPQQGYNKQQVTMALWAAGEMGQSQPVKSHAGRVIDLQGDNQGPDIDLEDMAPPESGDEAGIPWWAPAPPQFTPDSLEWSEDDDDWFPSKGETVGKSKGAGRTAGGGL